jgi:hypothetical protein
MEYGYVILELVGRIWSEFCVWVVWEWVGHLLREFCDWTVNKHCRSEWDDCGARFVFGLRIQTDGVCGTTLE